MDSSNPNDVVDNQADEKEETREERIKRYAQNWYDYRMLGKIPGTAAGDWAKAEHIVNAEDQSRDHK